MVSSKQWVSMISSVLVVCSCLLVSCSYFEPNRHQGVVAEYKGKYLYMEELDGMTVGLRGDDSARVADEYIYNWSLDMLLYDVARDRVNKEIERMVDAYRRALYIHAYDELLLSQRMPRELDDTLISSFYSAHLDHYVLRETILRGLLLVVPHGAPQLDELRRRLRSLDSDDSIEWIEKYAYQYATGYELFLDSWKSVSEIVLHMPFKPDDLRRALVSNRQVELKDSVNSYILQVSEVRSNGEVMPLEYARGGIEKMLLSERAVEFLESERKKLYHSALKSGELKLYEK